MSSPSRRTFLRTLLAGGAVVSLPAVTSGCIPNIAPAPTHTLDDAEVVSGQVKIALSKLPELTQEGGAVILSSSKLPKQVLVMHLADKTYAATAALCTHVGCPLGFDGTDAICPCHLSKFDTKGKVTQGPAKSDLDLYKATADATNLLVTLASGELPIVQPDGTVRFPFADYPQLKTPGLVVKGTPGGSAIPLQVLLKPDGASYTAVDPTCPHLQCAVAFEADKDRFLCPCHQSTFTDTGAVTKGPALRNLTSYVATADATGVTVKIS